MNSLNRQFGKLMSKGPGNSAKVSVLLNDFENADKMLTKVRHVQTKTHPITQLIDDPDH